MMMIVNSAMLFSGGNVSWEAHGGLLAGWPVSLMRQRPPGEKDDFRVFRLIVSAGQLRVGKLGVLLTSSIYDPARTIRR